MGRKSKFRIIIDHKWSFAAVISLVIAASSLELLQPLCLARIIDRVLIGGQWESLPFYVFLFFALLAAAQALRFLELILNEKLNVSISRGLRRDLWGKISRAKIQYFQKKDPGRWLSLFSEEISAVQDYFAEGAASFASHGAFLAGMLICVAVIDPKMLIVFAAAPVLFLAVSPVKKWYAGKVRQTFQSQETLYGFTDELIRNHMDIRQFRMSEPLLEEAGHHVSRHSRTLFSQARAGSVFPFVTESSGWLLTGAILLFGGVQVLHGSLSLGVWAAFLDYSRRFFAPLREISERWNRFQTALTALERLESIQKELEPERSGGEIFNGLFRRLEFRDVSFRYDKRDEWVLDRIHFTVRAGEKIAVTGPSGVGKSTLFKLMLALYEPDRGLIKIDGSPLNKWSPESIRRQFRWFSGDYPHSLNLSEFNQAIHDSGRQVFLLDEVEKKIGAKAAEELLKRVSSDPLLTVIWISHQENIVHSFPRVLVLNHGRIMADSSTNIIIQN